MYDITFVSHIISLRLTCHLRVHTTALPTNSHRCIINDCSMIASFFYLPLISLSTKELSVTRVSVRAVSVTLKIASLRHPDPRDLVNFRHPPKPGKQVLGCLANLHTPFEYAHCPTSLAIAIDTGVSVVVIALQHPYLRALASKKACTHILNSDFIIVLSSGFRSRTAEPLAMAALAQLNCKARCRRN